MRRPLVLLALVFLGCTAMARAGVSVHISVGGYGCGYHGGYYGHGYSYCYSSRYYAPVVFSGGYYGYPGVSFDDSSYIAYSPPPTPTIVRTPSPAPTSAPAKTNPATPLNTTPYGFNIGTKLIKSPWSGFVINGADKTPEQIVYDANTGQAFRIPQL